MSVPPSTSVTLLSILGSDALSTRWSEFARCYVPLMKSYCASRFPTLDADDLIQETLVSLVAALPNYTYEPDAKGHFHNYLTGILRHKALSALRKRRHDNELVQNLKEMGDDSMKEDEQEESEFRYAAYELGLRELLATPGIQSRTKQVFIQVAVNGKKPEEVATAFGITRNAVDQLKSRMIAKLRTIILQLTEEEPVH